MALLFVMVFAPVHAAAAIVKDEDKKVITEKAFKIYVPFIAKSPSSDNYSPFCLPSACRAHITNSSCTFLSIQLSALTQEVATNVQPVILR